MKINFHRVLLGFFENWDKSPQKKWDKGAAPTPLQALQKNGKIPVLQFWETWRYSLVKFRTIYRALV